MDKRKKIISELQKQAETVLALKQEHRQKRPIVIEFSGSPKAGKTSCINSLALFLKRNGFSVAIIQERASICPVSDKQSPMFNLWTACMSLAGLIGTLEDKSCHVDVLILDRGIFDALCWFQWLVKNKNMEEKQKEVTERFLLMEELVRSIDIVFAFCATPDVSIGREYATLLTDKPGSIMNKKVLGEYLKAIESTVEEKKDYFHKIFTIETSDKNQDEVGKEVTQITLDTLKDLLMERVGYLERDEALNGLLSSKRVFNDGDVKSWPSIKFDLRCDVEKNEKVLQPIPVAIITNLKKDRILVIKKNKNAVSADSPEKDKLLLYVGGHPRFEDSTEVVSKDFLSICRNALKREVKEEIGIAIALNDIQPFYLYTPDNERSKKHLAVCFLVPLDEDSIKLRLDSHELVMNKGKSKSGRFLTLGEICQEPEMESWSRLILEHCFRIKYLPDGQFNMFEYTGLV